MRNLARLLLFVATRCSPPRCIHGFTSSSRDRPGESGPYAREPTGRLAECSLPLVKALLKVMIAHLEPQESERT